MDHVQTFTEIRRGGKTNQLMRLTLPLHQEYYMKKKNTQKLDTNIVYEYRLKNP
jgi:hypothetical protein